MLKVAALLDLMLELEILVQHLVGDGLPVMMPKLILEVVAEQDRVQKLLMKEAMVVMVDQD